MKALLKKLVPSSVLDRYHKWLAEFAAAKYNHPSESMIVIGVTGTNGKTTVANMLAAILEGAGHKVGVTSTVNFKIGAMNRLNDQKMTMLGRTKLQALLAEMRDAKCQYAVIETSSEGIKQHRHSGVHYDAAIFTNLTPEHIESHGSYENYKAAKSKLFEKLAADPMKTIDGQPVPKVSVVNLESPESEYFLKFAANKKYGFLVDRKNAVQAPAPEAGAKVVEYPLAIVKALDVIVSPSGCQFTVRGTQFVIGMPGVHNIENALAAIAYGLSQGIPLPAMAHALSRMDGVPGRMEEIKGDPRQDFQVIVDYAPEPESMRKLYDVVALVHKKRVIHVLGSAGGGRDKDRRPVLGRLAAKGADVVIVTDEDPYDENPKAIIDEVAAGAREAGKKDGENLFVVLDRAAAIEKAVHVAQAGDLVLVTGKGAEQAMCLAHGKKLPWDDREELRKAIKRRYAATAPAPAEKIAPVVAAAPASIPAPAPAPKAAPTPTATPKPAPVHREEKKVDSSVWVHPNSALGFDRQKHLKDDPETKPTEPHAP